MNIKIYDAGLKHFDRFTVVYLDMPERTKGLFAARAMSCNPFHPLGFGQFTTAMCGRHLGKRIKFEELPKDCQKLVLSDLQEN